MRPAFWVGAILTAGNLLAGSPTNRLEIRSIAVDNKPVAWRAGEAVRLPAAARNVVFGFGLVAAAGEQPPRVRYKLESYDRDWQEGDGGRMLQLNQERVLEQERLRIAQDIHDDLGARVTQISLCSAMAQANPAFPAKRARIATGFRACPAS